ncbi:MAG: shikimate dehydrogenase [Lysobacteraceae bacterium]
MKRYAVFGHPVLHSLSPKIHQAFAKQSGIAIEYIAIECAPGDFAGTLSSFARSGGEGGNVTLPHKQRAAELCNLLSARAKRAGAVNTLIKHGNGWLGDNTDGAGLVRDLTGRHGLDLRGRRTLMIGAGGAARGIAPALLDAGIGDLFVVNRDSSKADALIDLLGEPERVHSRYFDDIKTLGEFELIVNATSASRHGSLPMLPMSLVGPRTVAVDLSYGEAAIPFLAWARAAHALQAIDGLGMLVEQAAESFFLWHGVRPDTDPVYAELQARHAALITGD